MSDVSARETWVWGDPIEEPARVDPAILKAALLLIISMTVIWLTVFDVNSLARLVFTLAFALTAPGWAAVAFWRPLETAMEWIVSIVLSIAASLAVSMGMLLANWWAPVTAMVGLAAVTSATLLLHVLRMTRKQPALSQPVRT